MPNRRWASNLNVVGSNTTHVCRFCFLASTQFGRLAQVSPPASRLDNSIQQQQQPNHSQSSHYPLKITYNIQYSIIRRIITILKFSHSLQITFKHRHVQPSTITRCSPSREYTISCTKIPLI